MSKTTNLGLELTTDTTTLFENWREAINGSGSGESKSNMQLIDEFAGKLGGGNQRQYLSKRTGSDFDVEWNTADSTPTAESDNLLSSGGAFTAISAIDNSKVIDEDSDGDVSVALVPDVFYNFVGNLTSLTLTFGASVLGRENEYKGQFLSGGTKPTVDFPVGIKWVGGLPDIEANKTYQFSILNGIGVMVGI